MKNKVQKEIGERVIDTILYLLQFRWYLIGLQFIMIALKLTNIIDTWLVAFIPTLVTIVLPIALFAIFITIIMVVLLLLILGLGILILWDKIENKRIRRRKLHIT